MWNLWLPSLQHLSPLHSGVTGMLPVANGGTAFHHTPNTNIDAQLLLICEEEDE